MQRKNVLRDNFQRRWNSAKSHLRGFRKSRDLEELHQFRVDVKKMRAILFLQKNEFGRGKIKNLFLPFEKIYKKAGKIRCADVSLKLLKRYGIENKKIEMERMAIIKKLSNRFILKTDSFIKKLNSAKKNSSMKLIEPDRHEIKKIGESQVKLLKRAFRKKMKSKLLHELRKNLKNLLYVNELFDRRISNEIKLNVAYLKELEETIGKWHDLDFTIELLENSKHNKKDVLKLHSKKKKQLSKIYKLTENFEKRVSLEKNKSLIFIFLY
ncbi:MAG: CHAD domain-containing protein [Bacteroidetes bacterium]|jgi:CHAD domain-containing protein|nr:CHAD domain-containing protein [Bacteroidota bacterium]